MKLASTTNAARATRMFKKATWLVFRVIDNITLSIGHDESDVQSGICIQLNQASTNPSATNTGPWGTWWQGELWYSSNVAGNFVVEIGTDPGDFS